MDYSAKNSPEARTGTSNSILEPYSEWGIEVEVVSDYYDFKKGQRLTLVNLFTDTVLYGERYVREELACVRWPNWGHKDWIPTRSILPVLRPFSALKKPLRDGTIPSSEIADLITHEPQFYDANYLYDVINSGLLIDDSIEIYLPSIDGVSVISLADWAIWFDESIVPGSVYEYLYSEHFAVDLQRHQFIDAI